jgi:hypothetical protein
VYGNYVVGYYSLDENHNKIFVILATSESKYVAMFIRDSYRSAWKNVGISTQALLYESHQVPKNYTFARES